MANFYGRLVIGLTCVAAMTWVGCSSNITQKKNPNEGNTAADFEALDAGDAAGGGTDSGNIDPNVVPEKCETNAQCAALVTESDKCLVALCDVTTQKCFVGKQKDLSECDDGDACTLFTVCIAGECVSPNNQALVCNDANPCTTDKCDPESGCQHEPTDGACNDGDPCTVADSCSDGVCSGEPGACGCVDDTECAAFDDGNVCNGTMGCENGVCKLIAGSQVTCPASDDPCVVAACDPTTGGCVASAVADGTVCNDGVSCTVGDTCLQGKCSAGADQCPSCVSSAECAPFDDGNACNGAVLCINGKCASLGPKSCPNPSPCLTSQCDPATGQCTQSPAPSGSFCDDFNPCTLADSCQNGSCKGGPVKNCDDNDPCTADECSPKTGGCQHLPVPGCGSGCGDGMCGPNENCQNCQKDCGACPSSCGDGVCNDNENCQNCPKDCDNCPQSCGDGACDPDESCKSCAEDCGPCMSGDGCQPTNGPGCGGCKCEGCVCKLDPYCCDIQWDELCVSECATECNGCGIIPPKCGDGQCGPDENCKGCPVDCGPCTPGNGCQPSDGPGCDGCGCENCVCALDAFCCDIQWDALCVSECTDDCNGCGIVPNTCGDGQCAPGETCQSCPKDCGTCPSKCGDGQCVPGETCQSCPKDCGTCPGGCGDGQCAPGESCQTCPKDCGTCPGGCGDGQCAPGETCQSCPKDCGTCPGGCGDGQCAPGESCQTCPKDCGTCPGGCGDGQCALGESCQTCPKDCGTCPGGCGDGQCAPGESCQTCPKDCGPCGGGDGCQPGDGPGCGGCACEACVCQLDAFCCDIQWDSLCVDECTKDCKGCPIIPGGCGDGQCGPNESCQTCPNDCGPCMGGCGDGACAPGESCQSCPKDCGPCPSLCGDMVCGPDENCQSCPGDCGPCGTGDGCQPGNGPGCNGCACQQCVCAMDPYCCQTQWDSICASECANQCNGCGIIPGGCGDGQCGPDENCQSCPKDCGPCVPTCGNGICGPDENCQTCPKDCGLCPNPCGNGICGPNENCQTCPKDCGQCPNLCGNGICGPNENCQTCPKDCGQCPSLCGNGTCGPNENCQSCPKDCGECPSVCGNGVCGPNENCLTCPVDCGPCTPPCGNGICEPNENCQGCPKDCGPCDGTTGCLPLDQAGCGGCACEECVCQADPFCCDVQWDGACVDVCAWKCNGCDPNGGCGDGVCTEGESCQNCVKDCGECSPQGAGCTVSEIAGCGGCACEACVCDTDSFCCEVQWDELCVEECASLCNGCDNTLPNCGDGLCSSNEGCQGCPKDCGECPPGGDGCYPTQEPGCNGCACEGCVCEMDPFCCDAGWDDICVAECAESCGGCDDVGMGCGDGVCAPGESCQSCPVDCWCQPGCGDGLCSSNESCTGCPKDCGECPPTTQGCVATNTPGCGGCPCEQCVCKMDSFCCTTAWDGICVNECKTPCGGCGGTPSETCGNKFCGTGESCTTCPQDCGQCLPICGDKQCNGKETCQTCPADCGQCLPICGDKQCNGNETCQTCSTDCGQCLPICGDKQCNGKETCQTCPADCGQCLPICGDKQCNGNETCQTCAADCGNCTNPGGLSCVDIYNCYMDCETMTCANQCIASGSDIGKKIFNVAYECVIENGCFKYETDAEIQNCAIQFCFQEIIQCVTQSPGGIAP